MKQRNIFGTFKVAGTYNSCLLAFTFVAMAFGSMVARAADLNEIAYQILTKSPQYQSEVYSLESAATSLKTESNLPDPELSGEYLVMPTDVDNRWTVQLEWGMDWPGVYKARAEEAKSKLSVAEKEMLAKRAERLMEIKDLLLSYIGTRQKMILLDELSQNNDTIFHLAESSARDGEMTILDLNKVKLEYANIRVARAALLDEEGEIYVKLSQIYGSDCLPLLQMLDCRFPDIIIPSQEEVAMLKEIAPQVESARAEAERARRGKNVAKMEALPSLSLGYKHAFEDGMHFNGVVAGVSLPIFSSRGKQKAAKAEILEAEFNAEASSLEIETEAQASLKRLEGLVAQINEIAPILENSDYNSALLKAYRGKVLTLIEYISDRNYFTTAAIELVNLRIAAAKELTYLRRYLVP